MTGCSKMRGLVIKKNADKFHVKFGEEEVICSARGVLKQEGVFVGDKVNFDKKALVIEEILPRKNLLIRPPIANLDTMIITIAPKPQPDLYLVDKLILFCFVEGITPILCVNKIEERSEFYEKMCSIYSPILKIVKTSALLEYTSELEKCIKGISAFAGQSAVGKSSLINAIFKENLEKTGNFAKKVERGKQTTRTVTLYRTKNGYIADTAGFSKLDENLINLEANEIARYYPDMLPYIEKCRYRSCLHKHSENCAIVEAVREGKISKERYENYLKFLEIKQNKGW